MELLPFPTLFAIAAGALILSLTVASSMTHRAERRVAAKGRRRS